MSATSPQSTRPSSVRRIDVRGPRVTAGVTAVVLLVVVALGLLGLTQAATILLGVQAAVFVIAAIVGAARHPYGFVFKLIRRRLAPASEWEDSAPPTFSQGVGFVVVALGLVLQLIGVPYAVVVAAAAAFIVAFVNSVFGFCVGCQIYLLLARLGLIRRTPETSS
ncbi:MAG TPA: DUF4395 domain-containing protein [Pseudolysinimonas sp.]|nr:DUF4395 domain-containing protein [Pseudolysinimonas sp.]